MKPLLENRQVERLLSLFIILYGLWLAIPYAETIVVFTQRYENLFTWLNLVQLVGSCLLIVFFSWVVRWIGYFATAGKPRSERRWFAKEILTIPLVLYVFTTFFTVFLDVASLLSVMFMASFIRDTEFSYLLHEYGVAWFFILLVYCGFAAVVLFNARRIVVWLLRSPSTSFTKNSSRERERPV